MNKQHVQPSDLKRGLRVHVEGWNFACQFVYEFTDRFGLHHIRTPKTNKKFTTNKPLWYTRRNQVSRVPSSKGHNPSGSEALASGRVHKQTAHENLTSPTERRGMGDGVRMELTPAVKAPNSRAGSPLQRPSEQQECSSL